MTADTTPPGKLGNSGAPSNDWREIRWRASACAISLMLLTSTSAPSTLLLTAAPPLSRRQARSL